MNDDGFTQLGLAFIYPAVGVLLALTERIERSKALRIWSLAFLLFALEGLVTAARLFFRLPESVRVISWLALACASVAGVAGTTAFIGRKMPKGLYVVGAAAIGFMLGGLAFGVDSTLVHYGVFCCVGTSFFWAGKLTYDIEHPRGIGRWGSSWH